MKLIKLLIAVSTLTCLITYAESCRIHKKVRTLNISLWKMLLYRTRRYYYTRFFFSIFFQTPQNYHGIEPEIIIGQGKLWSFYRLISAPLVFEFHRAVKNCNLSHYITVKSQLFTVNYLFDFFLCLMIWTTNATNHQKWIIFIVWFLSSYCF